MNTIRRFAMATSLALALANSAAAIAATDPKVAQLEAEVVKLRGMAEANNNRAQVENVFSHYMYLHNAYHDMDIIGLWAKKGTPGIHAQYSNLGRYTNWDSIMAYHRNRPKPVGKLLFHYITTPMIEIAGDGQTAKGLWIVNGLESGLTAPDNARNAPEYMYEKEMVDGKKVWMHNVYIKYGVDFIKQDGVWKIWHFHCYEVARAPYGIGWIPFAGKSQNESFNSDLMYFGDDGKPVFMPKADEPVVSKNNPYRTDTFQTLDARPPEPYRTFSETFEY